MPSCAGRSGEYQSHGNVSANSGTLPEWPQGIPDAGDATYFDDRDERTSSGLFTAAKSGLRARWARIRFCNLVAADAERTATAGTRIHSFLPSALSDGRDPTLRSCTEFSLRCCVTVSGRSSVARCLKLSAMRLRCYARSMRCVAESPLDRCAKQRSGRWRRRELGLPHR